MDEFHTDAPAKSRAQVSRPGRAAITAGLAAFAAGGAAASAAMLEGAVFSGLMAAIVWLASGFTGAAGFGRTGASAPSYVKGLRLIVGGSAVAFAIAASAGGLVVLLTGILAAVLGLLLVPSVSALFGAGTPSSESSRHGRDAGWDQERNRSRIPGGIDDRGFWQVNSALGGSGMWGYGFRRAYNPVTGEAGEWLGPGLIRKSDGTVIRVDAEGRPHTG